MNVLTFLLTFKCAFFIFLLDVSHSTFFYSMQGDRFSQHISGSLWPTSVFSLGIRMYSQDRSGQPVFLCPS